MKCIVSKRVCFFIDVYSEEKSYVMKYMLSRLYPWSVSSFSLLITSLEL